MIGEGGMSDAVHKEFEATLHHHELLKVRVRVGDRKIRDAIINEVCTRSNASLIARIGNIALIFRRNKDNPRIDLCNR